jgi:hypothetical protein
MHPVALDALLERTEPGVFLAHARSPTLTATIFAVEPVTDTWQVEYGVTSETTRSQATTFYDSHAFEAELNCEGRCRSTGRVQSPDRSDR